jgi:hypothetical protein
MDGIRTITQPDLMMPAGKVNPFEAALRGLLRMILLPIGLVFCALLFGIDAICKVLTSKWGKPRR